MKKLPVREEIPPLSKLPPPQNGAGGPQPPVTPPLAALAARRDELLAEYQQQRNTIQQLQVSTTRLEGAVAVLNDLIAAEEQPDG